MKRRTPKRMTKVQQLEARIKTQTDLIEAMRSDERATKSQINQCRNDIAARDAHIKQLSADHRAAIEDLKTQLRWHRIANENLIDAMAGTELRKRQAEEEQRRRNQYLSDRFRDGQR